MPSSSNGSAGRDIRTPLLMGSFLAVVQAALIIGATYLAGLAFSWWALVLGPLVAFSTLGILAWIGLGWDTFQNISHRQALQAEGILDIVIESLTHLRQGLNADSAREVAYLIFAKLQFDAVSITDTSTILAYVGEGENHHLPGSKIKTRMTYETLETGEIRTVNSRWLIGCPYLDCPLHSAVIAPLVIRDRAVGSLKLYYARPKEMGELEQTVASGLARLLSSQLELSELDSERQAALSAELRALQAQINPHFLFNALNTIAMFCRTKPTEARRLVLAFADFFRHTLQSPEDFITVREELEYVDNYLQLEKARYGDELQVEVHVPEEAMELFIPPLTIQPLAENAVKHGKRAGGQRLYVELEASMDDDRLTVLVHDDGRGFEPEVLADVLANGPSQEHGIGVFNVHRRLRALYQQRSEFLLDSDGGGTSVGFSLPLELCLPDDTPDFLEDADGYREELQPSADEVVQ